jgi:hypothetical protein
MEVNNFIIMQKLMILEEKINYLISLQQPQIQKSLPDFLPPQFSTTQFSTPQFSTPPKEYQKQQKMPDFQYKERMFPTGIEPQRFGALTRGHSS